MPKIDLGKDVIWSIGSFCWLMKKNSYGVHGSSGLVDK